MRSQRNYIRQLTTRLIFCAVCVLGACQGDGLDNLLSAGAIGPPGGRVRGDNGAVLEIPTGSLNAVYRFELKETEIDGPSTYTAITKTIEISPSKVSFSSVLPAMLFLPFSLSKIPAGRSLWSVKAFVYKDKTWTALKATADDGNTTISIPITKTGIYAAFIGPSTNPPTEPLAEPSVEPLAEPSVEPSAEPTKIEPAPEPRADAGGEVSPPERARELVVEPTIEPSRERILELFKEPASEPSKEPVTLDAGVPDPPTPDVPREMPPPEPTKETSPTG